MTPNIILFDIDNTLADMDHRVGMLDSDDPDWDAFEAAAWKDPPIQATIAIARALHEGGKQIWLWTGRSENIRSITTHWMHEAGVPYAQLIMRNKEEDRPTSMLKVEWLNHYIPRDRVVCAFDDDPRVVEALRKVGLLVMQVKREKGNE